MINEGPVTINNPAGRDKNFMRLRPIFEIMGAFLPILVLGIIGTVLGTDTFFGGMIVTIGYILSILIATVFLKIRGSSWREIGLARPQSWKRTVLYGVGVLLALVVMNIALQVIALNLPGAEVAPIDQSRFNPLEGNLVIFLLFVLLSWTTIAFGEEMFYRAFLITQLQEVVPTSKLGTVFVLFASSLIFGLVHWVEGPLGVMTTFAMGLILGAVYLRSGRNLWITIIAHGLVNSIRFLFLFLGAA
ncbi:MAG: CPBP family intramembrane metalloprotease [Anaerolineales bacterium]|nr:CPBP family intramembrane metalloprotease [Anaerolineales bacterium]